MRTSWSPSSPSPELLREVIRLLSDPHLSLVEVEATMDQSAGDTIVARRLVYFTPEAFGLVLISHLPIARELKLPRTFQARNARAKWSEFPFAADPVFVSAFAAGQEILHQGPRTTMETIADRSSLVIALKKAIVQGVDPRGGELFSPAMIGIPAELYE